MSRIKASQEELVNHYTKIFSENWIDKSIEQSYNALEKRFSKATIKKIVEPIHKVLKQRIVEIIIAENVNSHPVLTCLKCWKNLTQFIQQNKLIVKLTHEEQYISCCILGYLRGDLFQLINNVIRENSNMPFKIRDLDEPYVKFITENKKLLPEIKTYKLTTESFILTVENDKIDIQPILEFPISEVFEILQVIDSDPDLNFYKFDRYCVDGNPLTELLTFAIGTYASQINKFITLISSAGRYIGHIPHNNSLNGAVSTTKGFILFPNLHDITFRRNYDNY